MLNEHRAQLDLLEGGSNDESLTAPEPTKRTSVQWSVLFSRDYQRWPTPDDLFEHLDAEFSFTLDVCAEPDSAKCTRYFTIVDDGLRQDWKQERVWCNPPYNHTGAWLRKARLSAERGALCVCLIASRTDTRAFHEEAMHASELRFLRGRLRFSGAEHPAPFPSALVIFRPITGRAAQLSLELNND